MGILLLKRLRACCFLMVGLSFWVLPYSAIAQNCENSYQPAKAEMQKISKLLNDANSKDDYLDHVKQRSEAVEVLMFMAGACANNQSLSDQQRSQWRELATLLGSFQASANTSAFSDFGDWVQAKNADMKAAQAVK